MKTIIYIGGFELPDKNAAAQRVVANAKAFKSLGYNVVFIDINQNTTIKILQTKSNCFGFDRFSMQYTNKRLISISDFREVYGQYKDSVYAVVAYNYPAIALMQLSKFCRKHGVKVIADVTEWYLAEGNLLFRIIKTIDSEARMRWFHKKTDGIIAISDFLYNFYRDIVKTVKVPATVDICEEKWKKITKKNEKIIFVYAGVPDTLKERIDILVDAIEKLSLYERIEFRVIGITEEQYNEIYNVKYSGKVTHFLGRISHNSVIQNVKTADWTIVIRENNKMVKAGFPTKVTESISCGTPVIANRFSNISDYLNEQNSILCDMNEISTAVKVACSVKKSVDNTIFDYHNYLSELESIL